MTTLPPDPGDRVAAQKFSDPDWTAKGEPRGRVPLDRLATLWINTGTLCNITCPSCYIHSSPLNDRLAYITAAEALPFLIEAQAHGTIEIGFTGGEPFMNPEIIALLGEALVRGFDVLVLTNAMQPMQLPAIREGLGRLIDAYRDRLTIRVSLDHPTASLHDGLRGAGSFKRSIEGLQWLSGRRARLAIAGRLCFGESEAVARAAYASLIAGHSWAIEAYDRKAVVLLPEMDGCHDVPEITSACWDILGKRPSDIMCARSRMVVKRKGASRPAVLPCTLLPYDERFEMGASLAESAAADGGMFAAGAVKLCHPHCAKFCVLGGGSCS